MKTQYHIIVGRPFQLKFTELGRFYLKKFPWLEKGNWEDAEMKIDQSGNLIWLNGIWKNGDWNGGIFSNGVWKDGKWNKGKWIKGKDKYGYIREENDIPLNPKEIYISNQENKRDAIEKIKEIRKINIESKIYNKVSVINNNIIVGKQPEDGKHIILKADDIDSYKISKQTIDIKTKK